MTQPLKLSQPHHLNHLTNPQSTTTMGSSSSKLTRAAGRTRTYPTTPSPNLRTPPSKPSPAATEPPSTTPPNASFTKTESIQRDAADPDFAAMLQKVGAVAIPDAARIVDLKRMQNPQLRTLQRRAGLEQEAEKQGGREKGLLDVGMVRQILMYKEKGYNEGKIEGMMGLREGTVGRLGGAVLTP
ncbi:hypothetical protein EX30DRAFT_274069 [Ascodesmis nigricans]|uniref:Helix-turn-helix domain-containing protein n=1 Tax=Ascodesmis nigricans TaxID=341454 RepID=A0A4V3SHG8_9PEZI|nr:hypothetical protein EX30DRAFT_274069 [Ascodesmis nigricans]